MLRFIILAFVALSAALNHADVLVVGGGPAGLSVAAELIPTGYSVAIFDRGKHDYGQKLHNLFGWQDKTATDWRATVRKELKKHPQVMYRDADIVKAAGAEGKFRIADAEGNEWIGKRLVLAVGTDLFDVVKGRHLPEGTQDLWGIKVFPCVACLGLAKATRGESLAVIDGSRKFRTQDLSAEVVAALNLGYSVTWYANGLPGIVPKPLSVAVERLSRQDRDRITVSSRTVYQIALNERSNVIVSMGQGDNTTHELAIVQPKGAPMGDLHVQLGVGTKRVWTESPEENIDARRILNVDHRLMGKPGLYAAGDAASSGEGFANAIATGQAVGKHIAHDIRMRQIDRRCPFPCQED